MDVEKRSVRFLNRRGFFFEKRYPELLGLWKSVNAKRVILDGEIIVLDEQGKPNFYLLSQREHVDSELRINLLSKQIPATYVVFDLLHLDGKDVVDSKLMERKDLLNKVVDDGNGVVKCVFVEKFGKSFFEEVAKQGLEGVMAKKKDSPYLVGKRSDLWLKIKKKRTLDVIILGYTTGLGKREEFGSLVVGAYVDGSLNCLGKVGTGFDEQQIRFLLSLLRKIVRSEPTVEGCELNLPPQRKVVWVEPKYVCEVEFLEFTQDFMLRAPVFKRLRLDKPPEECVLESSKV